MLVFFFKQKTAYEMRISDWSSDVCSADLTGERRAGAHYTPPEVSRRVAAMALGGPGAGARRVVDMSCGGGALLLAAGDALVAAGADPADVARELLWGADIDPLAVAVTAAAIALWSGGTRPPEGHLEGAATPSDGTDAGARGRPPGSPPPAGTLRSDRKSTRLNSSH